MGEIPEIGGTKMKVLNIMNFVRQSEPRDAEVDKILFDTTKGQLAMVKEMDVENTFLLQYDALCDEKYVELFKREKTDKIELGLWYEVVADLTDAVGMEYKSEYGWRWDWHIQPGFPMFYTLREREILIDEAMCKFKEVFGYYPKTVGSWVTDTHTLNHLAEHYEISAFCNCRDQVNTDAYTLIGGYYNQAYYPSKANMFTPARSAATQMGVPMFRLLGPDPIHNYDGDKYIRKEENRDLGPYTMEVISLGKCPDVMDWMYRSYYENESMSFAYAQIGQENSFGYHDLVTPVRMQIEKAKALDGVQILKMCDTGEAFKQAFTETPVTSLVALDNWDNEEIESVYYNCKNYSANLFRYDGRVFLRALYLFDDTIADPYADCVCTTFDAKYENQPVADSVIWGRGEEFCGIYLDFIGGKLSTEKLSDTELKVLWDEKWAIFDENGITVKDCAARIYPGKTEAEIWFDADRVHYAYRGHRYAVCVENGTIRQSGPRIAIEPTAETMRLTLVLEQ